MPCRALLFSLLAIPLAAAPGRGEDQVFATTTSVRDTGLLHALLPRFEKRAGIRVKALSVGSGAALRLGADGNADLVLSHAPEAEEGLVRAGKVLSREVLMENFFVIAGPPEDPAKARDAASAADALRRIAESRSPYASRGDDSGTHQRERALLRSGGLDPAGGWPGFVSTGSGMGQTLRVAGERRAYALSDAATFLAFRERVGLVELSKREPALRNVYSVLVFRPAGRAREEVLARPADPAVARLVGMANLVPGTLVAGEGELDLVLLAGRGLARTVRPGDSVTLSVRPEDVHLLPRS